MRRAVVPANKFLAEQYDARSKVRRQFYNDSGELRHAHDLLMSSISLCLDRHSNQPFRESVSADTAEMLAQLAQQTALFLQGNDLCEVAIAEGMYVQASALLKQRMETVATSHEIWRGTRQPLGEPSLKSLPTGLQPYYSDLSQLSQAKVSERIEALTKMASSELVGAAMTPTYNKTLAMLLFRIEIMLLLNVVELSSEFLKLGYGAGYDKSEVKLQKFAFETASKAAIDLFST